jgi:hypothetical protein
MVSNASPLTVSFDKTFVKDPYGQPTLGPFNTSSSVAILATLTNASATDLTICDPNCAGAQNTFRFGGLAIYPSGYSFYFGNNPGDPGFGGQLQGTLGAGQSKDFVFGVYVPDANLQPGRYGFSVTFKVIDTLPTPFDPFPRSFDASLKGEWAVVAVPEPETYAMLLAGLGLIGAAVRRKRTAQV